MSDFEWHKEFCDDIDRVVEEAVGKEKANSSQFKRDCEALSDLINYGVSVTRIDNDGWHRVKNDELRKNTNSATH